MEFGISTEISGNHEFSAIEEKLRALLKEQGFGILTEINVQEVMKEKLGLEKRPYKILGACNPPRANKVMDADAELGIFLPCNVVIYQTESGSTIVSATNANAMFSMINNKEVEPIAKEVSDIFTNVIDNLGKIFEN